MTGERPSVKSHLGLQLFVAAALLVLTGAAFVAGLDTTNKIAGVAGTVATLFGIAYQIRHRSSLDGSRSAARTAVSPEEEQLAELVTSMVAGLGSARAAAAVAGVDAATVSRWRHTRGNSLIPADRHLRSLWAEAQQRQVSGTPELEPLLRLRQAATVAREARRIRERQPPHVGPQDDPEKGQQPGTTDRLLARLRARPVVGGLIVTGAVAAVVGIFVVVQLDGSPGVTPTPTPTSSPHGWPFNVVNAKNGTFGYAGPYSDPEDKRRVESYFQGDVLHVVCRERNGRIVTDPETLVRSSVWNRLDVGLWVSDLYVARAPSSGDRADEPIPDCP